MPIPLLLFGTVILLFIGIFTLLERDPSGLIPFILGILGGFWLFQASKLPVYIGEPVTVNLQTIQEGNVVAQGYFYDGEFHTISDKMIYPDGTTVVIRDIDNVRGGIWFIENDFSATVVPAGAKLID